MSATILSRGELDERFDRLPAITLDELVDRAELLTRVDRKYLLPLDVAAEIAAHIDPGTRVLEIDGARTFGYDSIYFDTDDHLAHRLTAHRRRRRFKLRTRLYADTGGCFLEVKTKDGRGRTVKERIPYAAADRTRLTPDGRRFADGILRRHGHADVAHQLAASMSSRYRRTTLLLPGGSRATVDTALEWTGREMSGHERSGREPERHVSLDDHVIIETKSANRVSDLDRILWHHGHRPLGISKRSPWATSTPCRSTESRWAPPSRGRVAPVG